MFDTATLSSLQEELVVKNLDQEKLLMQASQTNMGIGRMTILGRVEIVNQQFCQIIGYAEEQLIDVDIRTIIPQDNLNRFDILFSELTRGIRTQFGIQLPFTTPDGNTRWVFLSATCKSDVFIENSAAAQSSVSQSDTDSNFFILCIIHDISEQKRREEQDKLSSIAFSHSGDGIMITDASHTIVKINPAFSKISGFEENEIVGRKPFLLRSGEHDETFYNRIWKTLELEGIWQGEVCYRHKCGNLFYVWETISAVTDNQDNLLHYISILADITEIRKRQKVLNDLANYDALTELPNRYYLEANLQQIFEETCQRKDKFALLFIDLNKFKPINDQYGHKAGDRVLMEIAHRLTQSIRVEDTAARIGGDEFIIVMPRINQVQVVESIARRIHQAIELPFHLTNGTQVSISCSIGICILPDDLPDQIQYLKPDQINQTSQTTIQQNSIIDSSKLMDIIELADQAMYEAKAHQKAICFFDEIKNL
ncbi:diguanylate cyclase domain-containing protein [Aliikangiella maris]|uniref:Diguanylate cyclase n=2 Tax=Aliikangiella maris TaxID=3162458 RepID=A0ABV2BYZ4_9GAMM